MFVDIDPVTFTMDPARLEAAITPRTKAILPVHLYGQPADMDPILDDRARATASPSSRTPCQAHGAEYKGRRAGSMGDSGCFSFYPGKNLGAYGEGGAVVTNNAEHRHRRCACCATGARRSSYHHVLKGFNYRMEGFQGAVLRVKLRHLETGRRRAARARARYDELLAGGRHASHAEQLDDRAARLSHLRRPHRRSRRAAAQLQADGHPDRPPLPDPGPPAGGATPTSGTRRATSRVAERGRRRSAVAADVPGDDRRAAGRRWSPRCREATSDAAERR